MASANVETILKAMKDDGVLVAELSLALAKCEQSAGVDLSPEEKAEFFKELAEMMGREGLVWWY